MRVVKSNKFMNEIIVDVEEDTNTDYLWKWGMYKELPNGNYKITPPDNGGRITFQSALECLVRVANS